MKYKGFLIICLSSIFFFTACMQNRETEVPKKPDNNLQTTNKDKKDPYDILGDITIQINFVIVHGKTNLKPGSKLILSWKNQNLGEMEVKKDGSFKLTVDRPKFQLGDEILILFNPDLQSKKIQSLYGNKGQKLKGRYLYHYSKEGINYAGLKAGTYIDNLHIQIMDNVIQSNKILKKQRQDFLDKQK